MAKIFKLKSGTEVAITDETVEINRTSSKNAGKELFDGHAPGRMVIRKNAYHLLYIMEIF